jgi:hypothetical protein
MVNPVFCQNITDQKPAAIVEPFSITAIEGYRNYSADVKKLLAKAALLTQMNLTYLYGSADPAYGGMDCSGTIYYLLSASAPAAIPRDANGMYEWLKKNSKFHEVTSYDLHSPQFSQLKPGDLLFWSGTYAKGKEGTITHVMLYLGTNKNHEPLMFGSSDGRTYRGKKNRGVSLFDFKLPNPQAKSHFVGYGCIPSITCHQ